MGKYFNDCKNPAELDTRYQGIKQVFDLDNMDQGNVFKIEVEAEYNSLMKDFSLNEAPSYEKKDELTLEEIVLQIRSLNLQGEICGSWLWLSSKEAHTHRETLKGLGFRYSPSKRSWYFRRYANRSSNANPIPLQAIREKYGTAMTG